MEYVLIPEFLAEPYDRQTLVNVHGTLFGYWEQKIHLGHCVGIFVGMHLLYEDKTDFQTSF